MKELFTEPLFGVLISLVTFEIGLLINRKTRLSLFNPLLISVLLIITLLKILNISYDDFNRGGQLIAFFLGPATVILALPLYKKLSLLKKNFMPIIIGIITGSIAGMISVIVLSRLFGLSDKLTVSLLPKSITTPIGMEVSKQLGGIPSITVVIIIITGIVGSIIGPFLLRLFKITDEVAVGISMGNSSHAIGTAKALEIGQVEGAMSGLTIGLAGILTVLLAPAMWELYKLLK